MKDAYESLETVSGGDKQSFDATLDTIERREQLELARYCAGSKWLETSDSQSIASISKRCSTVCRLDVGLPISELLVKGFGKGTKYTLEDKLRVMQNLAEVLSAAESAKESFGWKETSVDKDLASVRSSLVTYGKSHPASISTDTEWALSRLVSHEQTNALNKDKKKKPLQARSGGKVTTGSPAKAKPNLSTAGNETRRPTQAPDTTISSAKPHSQLSTNNDDLDLKPLSRGDTGVTSMIHTAKVALPSGKKALITTTANGKAQGWARVRKSEKGAKSAPSPTKSTVRSSPGIEPNKPSKKAKGGGSTRTQNDEEAKENVVPEEPGDDHAPEQEIPAEDVDSRTEQAIQISREHPELEADDEQIPEGPVMETFAKADETEPMVGKGEAMPEGDESLDLPDEKALEAMIVPGAPQS